MPTPPVKRKLAAILAADAVGYSRMMAADEEGTMRILSAHRSMIDGIIEFHEGRIINTAGDSVLAEFASPTQAVRCAVEVQDALKTRNDALPEGRQMQFRIGVNLGDVMVKGEDLLGDGVNVAARLESIAEPGHITISSSVYEQIAGKLDLGFVDLGEQSLKNIDRPVRAYRVERGGLRGTRPARSGRAPALWIGVGLLALAIAAAAAWLLVRPLNGPGDAAVQAQAEAEIAKARADAEEARKAAALAQASADAANRALEEQRLAESRARAQAELAAARNEAETTRRKAAAELAAATEARRAAEAARVNESRRAAEAASKAAELQRTAEEAARSSKSKQLADAQRAAEAKRATEAAAASRAAKANRAADAKRDAEAVEARRAQDAKRLAAAVPAASTAAAPRTWSGYFSCEQSGSTPQSSWYAVITANDKSFSVGYGQTNKPGSLLMHGERQDDGALTLAGTGISGSVGSYGQTHPAQFSGRFGGNSYTGKGYLGSRACSLSISGS
jgi:class 3 adenylate cyclase